MSNRFPPNIRTANWEKDNYQDSKQMIDFGVDLWQRRQERRSRISKLYLSHNGIIDSDATDYITHKHGKQSKTTFKRYRLGRVNIKRLIGEFLKTDFDSTVIAVNRDTVSKKGEHIKQMVALSYVKDKIEQVRSLGIDPYPGLKIPEKNNKSQWSALNFKTQNELYMQTVMDAKTKNEDIKFNLKSCFKDLTLTSEVFGKIEKDINGEDTFRFIPVDKAIFLEIENDFFLERTPIIGEVKSMFPHEIIEAFPDLKKTDQDRILQFEQTRSSEDWSRGKDYDEINGEYSLLVYILEWKSFEDTYQKISYKKGSNIPYIRRISKEQYEKNKKRIEHDVKNGRYEIKKLVKEVIWEGVRIGADIYTDIKKKEEIIQQRDKMGKYKAKYDYCGGLFDTVDGDRVSLQEIIADIEFTYDQVRFQINKELNKIKGTALFYNYSALGLNQQVKDILYDLDEHGAFGMNASAEQNQGNFDYQVKDMIEQVDLGDYAMVNNLMNIAAGLEETMERLTGFNDVRQGMTNATKTATGSMQDLEASTSVTYDLFDFMNLFTSKMLTNLAQKSKITYALTDPERGKMIIGEDAVKFFEIGEDLVMDDYIVKISDGRREAEILRKIESLFAQEINAGQIRTADIAKFWQASSYSKKISILETAHKEIQAIQEQMQKIQMQQKEAESQRAYQLATEDREDKQAHELELQALKNSGDIQRDKAKMIGQSVIEGQKAANQSQLQREQNEYNE